MELNEDELPNNNIGDNPNIPPPPPHFHYKSLVIGFVCLVCLMIVSLVMLIAGSYYTSIYDQNGGIEYQETTCVFEKSWYEASDNGGYTVKADVYFAINGEILNKTMQYNDYADRADADLVSMFLLQFSPNITCYYHPLIDGPVRTPIDVHKNMELGLGLLIPALVAAAGGIIGSTLICIRYKKQLTVEKNWHRQYMERRAEGEQRR